MREVCKALAKCFSFLPSDLPTLTLHHSPPPTKGKVSYAALHLHNIPLQVQDLSKTRLPTNINEKLCWSLLDRPAGMRQALPKALENGRPDRELEICHGIGFSRWVPRPKHWWQPHGQEQVLLGLDQGIPVFFRS